MAAAMVTLEHFGRQVLHFPVMGDAGDEAWRLVLGDSQDKHLFLPGENGKKQRVLNEFTVPETVGTPLEPCLTKTMVLQPAPKVHMTEEQFKVAFPEGSLNERVLSNLIEKGEVHYS